MLDDMLDGLVGEVREAPMTAIKGRKRVLWDLLMDMGVHEGSSTDASSIGARSILGVRVIEDESMPNNVIHKLDAQDKIISMLVQVDAKWYEMKPDFGP